MTHKEFAKQKALLNEHALEMLTELKGVHQYLFETLFESKTPVSDKIVVNRLEAIISKAEGRSS